jgi:transcriptional regulator with XRE-family HTH domain
VSLEGPLNPTIRDLLTQPSGLASRLRALRTRTGLNGKELAERLDWPAAKVSRFENGARTPTANDLRAWAAACGDPGAADDLIDRLTEAQSAHLD